MKMRTIARCAALLLLLAAVLPGCSAGNGAADTQRPAEESTGTVTQGPAPESTAEKEGTVPGTAEAHAGNGAEDAGYRTEEIWCANGDHRIYGEAYVPQGEGPFPLVIFSHELGNSHESGVRYAERLAENGYAAYVFDFCGGSAPGTENQSDGTNAEMSVLTEAADLEAVLDAAKGWDFADSGRIFLLGGSQGGLVTIVAGSRRQDEIAGMMLMYPALSAKEDHGTARWADGADVPDDVPLFGGWMHVGSRYVTDLRDLDFDAMLAGYAGKVLLLHGDSDSTVGISWSESAAGIIPDCEFHVISGGGHEFYGKPFEDAVGHILSYLAEMTENDNGKEGADMRTDLKMTIGGTAVEVDWEDNAAVDALRELAAEGLTVRMSMYGGFEQVGPLGTSLPSDDRQTVTGPGDVVLYAGDRIVVFYGSNSWAYTRLGHITDRTDDELRGLLGSGDVTVTLTAGS